MADDNKPLTTAEEYYERAEKHFEAHDYKSAFRDYTEAVHLRPDYAAAWSGLGGVWFMWDEFDKALTHYSQALNLDQNFAEAWAGRGITLTRKGEHEKALEDCNKAIRLNPSHGPAWAARGFVWSQKNEQDKALVDYDEAIRLEPERAEIWSNRGFAWAQKGDLEKAISDCSEAIRLKPKYAPFWNARGAVWARQGEYDKAISDYNEALRLNPEDKGVIHNRAAALAMKASEAERTELAERLRKEFSEQLEKDLQAAKGQVIADTEDFQKEENENMNRSEKLRKYAMGVLIFIVLALLIGFWKIYCIETSQNQNGEFDNWTFLSWMPAVTALSSPLFLLWWMLQRWSYETKTLAYGFQRKRIVEERIFRFSGDDEKLRKELLKIYIVHWMEKSPLEVMLAIGGKGKSMGGGSSPTATLLESAENIIDKTDKAGD